MKRSPKNLDFNPEDDRDPNLHYQKDSSNYSMDNGLEAVETEKEGNRCYFSVPHKKETR